MNRFNIFRLHTARSALVSFNLLILWLSLSVSAVVAETINPSSSAERDHSGNVEICLRRSVEVSGPVVALGDVARLRGDAADVLADVRLGELGRAGMVLTIEDVREALEQAGVNPAAVTLTGYTTCAVAYVPGDAATLTPVAVANAAAPLAAADGIAGDAADDATSDASSAPPAAGLGDRIHAALAAAAGVTPAELVVDWTEHDAAALAAATGSHGIELVQERLRNRPRVLLRPVHDAAAPPIEVRPTLRQRVAAAVLTQAVRRGDPIPADAVEMRDLVVSLDDRPIVETAGVVGQRAARALLPGEPIVVRDLEVPLLVRRGELVTVEATAGTLVIRTVARAMADGGQAEMIRLRNEGTREQFTATVTGRRTARVDVDWMTLSYFQGFILCTTAIRTTALTTSLAALCCHLRVRRSLRSTPHSTRQRPSPRHRLPIPR